MKKGIILSIALIILTALVAKKQVLTQQDLGAVKGSVFSKEGKIAISNATVKLIKDNKTIKHTQTDIKGQFVLKEIPAGIYSLQVIGAGYDNYLKKNVSLLSNKTTQLSIVLFKDLTEDEPYKEHVNLPLPPAPTAIEVVEDELSIKDKAIMQINAAASYAKHSNDFEVAPPQFYNNVLYHNTEEYDVINENSFQNPLDKPLSTFSIDVDNASYANVRRMINMGQLPQKDVVRIEEMINYFNYDYTEPNGRHPFSIHTEVSTSPWNAQHKLVHIGLQGKKLNYDELAPSNLVFLIDVSGSMNSQNKLPLVKSALKMLVNELKADDRIALVTYASSTGVVLPSTPVAEKETILSAINNLGAGGSTAGGAGIKLAYKTVKENFIKGGNNRVILATDGDFNVGTSSTAALVELIKEYQKEDIFLTITGFGMGNYKDGRMEQISNAGNGNYYYIDNINEATKVFVKEMRATLFTIASDVKIQVEFNPEQVGAYRLIGYENRSLKDEDFNDDKVDAGEIGAEHTVSAIYEIIPKGVKSSFINDINDLKYQKKTLNKTEASSFDDELLTVKFRYKPNLASKSILLKEIVKNTLVPIHQTSNTFKFSAAVAGFALLLRNSEYKGTASYEDILQLAKASKGEDEEGYRAEFINLVKAAQLMQCVE